MDRTHMTFQNALRCFIGRALRAHRTGKKAALGLNPAPARPARAHTPVSCGEGGLRERQRCG